ncbi:TPA: hypothetical protein R4K21_003662 [Stenotrophomonas maltophilia]|nr:hypothetical protein [Stenotrophomonas maltophilia]
MTDQQSNNGESEVGPGGYPVLINDADMLATAVVNGWIIDARSGGLVKGRRHEKGHIVIVQPSSPLGVYELVGVMEGGEYLMSTGATAAHMARLVEINADRAACDSEIPEITPGRVIDARAEPHDKLLIVYKQFIINRESTKRHLQELIALNDPFLEYNGQFFGDTMVQYLLDHPELGDAGPQS